MIQSYVDDQGRSAWPKTFNLAEYFLDHNLALGRAEQVALVCGERTQSYAQLVRRSRQVAAVLRRLGVRPEERVLLCLNDGFEFAEVFFGVLRAGAVFAMVNPLLNTEAFVEYLQYTKARVAFVDGSVGPAMQAAQKAVPGLQSLIVVGGDGHASLSYEELLDAEDPRSALAETEATSPDDLAGWLFTSGSTGRPKACVHMHSDFAYSTETYARQIVGYGPQEVTLGVPKLFFGYATGTNLMFPLRFGGKAVLFAGRSTADELFDQIARHRPSLLTSVPTMINQMLRSPRLEGADLGSLRVTLSAGEALPERIYREWKQRTGNEILDGIGSAEMFHIYISNRFGEVRLGSLGRLVPGYEAQIVDPEGVRLADGQPGRLRVRGESTALCYWAEKRQSQATFQGDWCTSADVFRRDEQGYFYYEGRADDLLKVSGIWVSPLEIENALLEHAAVAEVCVVPADEGQGLIKPLAFVVPKPGFSANAQLAEQLKQHLKQRLAPHKYPRWFEWRSELPKNDRGKVARKELSEQAARLPKT